MKNNIFKIVALCFVLLAFLQGTPALAVTDYLRLEPQLRTTDSLSTKIVLPDKTLLVEPADTSADTSTAPVKDTSTVTISPELLKKIQSQKKIEASNTDDKPGLNDPAAQIQAMFSEYWVQMLALIVSVVGVILAISGFSLANKKKRKYLKKFLHEIDNVYASYKWKSHRCEAELYRLQDQIEDRLKAGQIDENTYHLLESRIQKYLDEIKDEVGKAHSEMVREGKKSRHQNVAKKLADQIDEAGKDL